MSIYKTGFMQRAIGSLRRRGRTPDAHETPPTTTYQPYYVEPLKRVDGTGFGLYVASERFPREQDRVDSRKVLDLLPRYGLGCIPTRCLHDSESLSIETDRFFKYLMTKEPEEISLPILVTASSIVQGYSGFLEISQFLEEIMPKPDGQSVTTNAENL